MSERWRWAAARSTGTSHHKSGLPCQDFGVCEVINTPDGPVLVALVSDGAGSASLAQLGSKAVSTGLLRCARSYLATRSLDLLTEEHVWDWVDEVREFISAKAIRKGAKPRDFAATLVGALISKNVCIILHIGDGAAVLRRAGSNVWEVPSWPYQGEYASTTAFITDDPQPRLVFMRINDQIHQFALFSDGIERMVLETASKSAHGPFFNRMVAPLLASGSSGVDVTLSLALRSYLASPAVCDRTDDDKTLILGVRL